MTYMRSWDRQKADYYRNLIITQFPDSKYAQFLLNPNFFIELEARTDSLNNLYQTTFRKYKSGLYRDVISNSNSMKNLDPDSILLSKIDFMLTVANGTQTDMHNFESLLKGYITNYPSSEPTPLADEILTLIQDSTLADYQKLVDLGYISEEIQNEELLPQNSSENDEFGGKFSYEEDLLHYFVIAYPREQTIDLNRLKFDIANYNIDHYTKIDFDIETENLNDEISLLLVRALKNKENSLIYHRAIIRRAQVFKTLIDADYVNFVASSTNYRQLLADQSLADYLKFFVRNYSRYIKSDFSEEELEVSPEELMARAQQEEEALQERGEFIVVNTGPESIFNTDVDTTQNFVLAIKDKRMSTRQLLNGFSQFNRDEFRIWGLALQLKSMDEYQLMVVNGIPSLNESMSYFRKVVVNRDLFEPLGQATYRNFLITNENLQVLMNENNVDEYLDFFRGNYSQRTQSQQTKPATTVPVTNVPATTNEESTIQEQNIETEAEVPEEYTGPYSENIEGAHYFVFVLPKDGYFKADFLKGIEDFNRANYGGIQLNIEERPLDDIREIIAISGLTEKADAQLYFSKVVNTRDLYTPLGTAIYRNFLITEENFNTFLQEKNIVDYMNFYKRVYLGQ